MVEKKPVASMDIYIQSRTLSYMYYCVSAVNHSLSLSRISMSGCLGLPMRTREASSGLAFTSALKYSEFSGKKSSAIVTL